MPPQYTKSQIEKVQEKLPEELLETLFSVETAETLWDIAKRHDLMDERGSKMSDYVGYVLMGILLPQEFSTLLEKELKLSKKTAEQVAREINRFIFYPIKPALEQLHRMEIEVTAKIVTPKPSEQPEEQEPEQKLKGEDRYREEIE